MRFLPVIVATAVLFASGCAGLQTRGGDGGAVVPKFEAPVSVDVHQKLTELIDTYGQPVDRRINYFEDEGREYWLEWWYFDIGSSVIVVYFRNGEIVRVDTHAGRVRR